MEKQGEAVQRAAWAELTAARGCCLEMSVFRPLSEMSWRHSGIKVSSEEKWGSQTFLVNEAGLSGLC